MVTEGRRVKKGVRYLEKLAMVTRMRGLKEKGMAKTKLRKEVLHGDGDHTWIGDGKDADAEVFTAGGSQLDVVAVVMMDASLGQHGVVLNLAFAAK